VAAVATHLHDLAGADLFLLGDCLLHQRGFADDLAATRLPEGFTTESFSGFAVGYAFLAAFRTLPRQADIFFLATIDRLGFFLDGRDKTANALEIATPAVRTAAELVVVTNQGDRNQQENGKKKGMEIHGTDLGLEKRMPEQVKAGVDYQLKSNLIPTMLEDVVPNGVSEGGKG